MDYINLNKRIKFKQSWKSCRTFCTKVSKCLNNKPIGTTQALTYVTHYGMQST